MFVLRMLVIVHVTAHSVAERERALHLLGKLLGPGNHDTREGFWPYYPLGREPDVLFSHWFSLGDTAKLQRLVRYLVWLRAALRQEAILFEVHGPGTQVAIGIEEGDTWQAIYGEVASVLVHATF
jgi:hypothetical protein